jgi:hypothetical protein
VDRSLIIPASDPLPSKTLYIPRGQTAHPARTTLLGELLLHRVFYPQVYRAARSGRSLATPFKGFVDTEAGRRFLLVPPEPWIVALAAIMWEGILQGLAWDTIKTGVRETLEYLQSKGDAPTGLAGGPTRHFRSLDVRFRWRRYGHDGRLRYSMYVRLNSVASSLSTRERDEILLQLRSSDPAVKSSRNQIRPRKK